MKTSILFGNGFNRLINTGIGWEDILTDIQGAKKFDISGMPYTMVYERALLETSLKDAKIFRSFEFDLKNKLAELMLKMQPSFIYDKLIDLKLDNYITTNYDYCLNQSLKTKYSVRENSLSTEDIYSIRRQTQIVNEKTNKTICTIWNIHGEINRPVSIMLGYDHYVGSMGKLEGYVKGTYDFFKENEKIRPETLSKKIKSNRYDTYSWVDLFVNTNIHIVAVELNYSEIDIYWLLNKRIRIFREMKVPVSKQNKIYFYTNKEDISKKGLLESFDVNVIYRNMPHSDLYEFAIENISLLK